MNNLPAHPATAPEQYLAAILATLEDIRDRLPERAGGQGELREPRTPTPAAKAGPGAVPRRPARTTRTTGKKGGGK
jgi:hypothetical protein